MIVRNERGLAQLFYRLRAGSLRDDSLIQAIYFLRGDNQFKPSHDYAGDLVNLIKRDLIDEMNVKQAWAVIDDIGGSDTALELAYAIKYRELSGDNLNQAWNFVLSRSDVRAINFLIGQDLIAENIDRWPELFSLVKLKADKNDLAVFVIELIRFVINNPDPSIDKDQIWNFLIDINDKETNEDLIA